jgi:hypothetical protein
MEVEWKPRFDIHLQMADFLSKAVPDPDDWAVAENIFNFAQKRWGIFTCDAFADNTNNRVLKFYSKTWCPDSAGINALTYPWSLDFLWLVPPPLLLLDTILKLKADKGRGVLICPKWTSAPFWVKIYNYQFMTEVRDFIEYVNPSNLFIAGSFSKSVFAQRPFNTNVLMLMLDFSHEFW